MGLVKLLDCTLRDGGYVNDWRFGEDAIVDIFQNLLDTNIDILELGFLKNEPYQEDRTVFNSVSQINKIITPKRDGIKYAAMIEVVNPLPLEMLDPADKDGIDIIRVIVWKRMLKEGFDYCKGIVEKGYSLSVQPARVDQYSEEEFINMIELYNTINPLVFYVVDSWGTQYTPALLNYMRLADKYLKPGIAIGYHGHNNLMQAFDAAREFANQKIDRDIYIDSSIFGMGRGAGNLNTELIAKYLNEAMGQDYKISPMIGVYEKYIKEIFQQYKWGYSIAYLLSAQYNCNPDYANYFDNDLGLPCDEIEDIIKMIPEKERIIYSQKKADDFLQTYKKR